jgi:hypothetical protein
MIGREVLRQRGGGAASDSRGGAIGFGPALSGGLYGMSVRHRGGQAECGTACGSRWRRGSDAWALARKAETDRWDPRQNIFELKTLPK